MCLEASASMFMSQTNTPAKPRAQWPKEEQQQQLRPLLSSVTSHQPPFSLPLLILQKLLQTLRYFQDWQSERRSTVADHFTVTSEWSDCRGETTAWLLHCQAPSEETNMNETEKLCFTGCFCNWRGFIGEWLIMYAMFCTMWTHFFLRIMMHFVKGLELCKYLTYREILIIWDGLWLGKKIKDLTFTTTPVCLMWSKKIKASFYYFVI